MFVNFEKISCMSKNRHIAVILAGSFGGLAVTRELGKYGVPVIVIGRHEYVTKSKYCLGMTETAGEEIIAFLKELPKHVEKKPVLLTDDENYLKLLEDNWVILAPNYLAPISLNNQRLTNKRNLFTSAKNIGLKVPIIYDSPAEVAEYPVLVKPLSGIAHTNPQIEKAYECHDSNRLVRVLGMLKQHGAEACIQQIIPGDAQGLYSITLYRNPRGEIIIGYVMKKLKQYPSDYGTGTSHITCRRPEIIRYTERLLESVNFVGVAEIEYKYCSKSNDFYIIEVNGRFPMHSSMIHKLGTGFAYQIYCDLTGSPLNKPQKTSPIEKEVVWTYLLKDVITSEQRLFRLLYYLRNLSRFAIQGAFWDWSDPKPTFYLYKHLCSRLLVPLHRVK